MKRTRILAILAVLCASLGAGAQDTATEQRLNELTGKIEELLSGQEAHRKQIDALAREVRTLAERQNTPNAAYASQEDLKHLADAIKEVDRKRLDDNEKVRAELGKLVKTLSAAPLPSPKKSSSTSDATPKNTKPEAGFEYTVQKNDTLSLIVKAVREQKNIKVTAEQILKANPTMKAERLQVGQKIFIPLPAS